MANPRINGSVEFHSFDDDPDIGSQIDEWVQQYPAVEIVDTKFEVVSYVENNVLKFATFALVFFHEPEAPAGSSGLNQAMTQKMELPNSAQGRRWRS